MPEALTSPRPPAAGAGAIRSDEVLVRECGVFSELLPHTVEIEEIRRRAPRGLMLSGGPASVYAPDAPRLRPELLELGIPVLGICYGMQAMVLTLGGRVESAEVGEFGRSRLTVADHGR